MKNLIILFIYFLLLTNVKATEPLAIFDQWIVFQTVDKNKNLLCYSVSLPIKRYDNFNKRGQSFFIVIKEKGVENLEVYLSHGQVWNKGISDAELDIAKRKYPLLTYEDKAWAYNTDDDKNIIEDLSKSALFTLHVDFNGNKKLIDIYSLSGFNESIKKIEELCK